MKNTSSTTDAAPKRSTLTFEEIMEVLEEELADYLLEDKEYDTLAPLDFDKINGK